MASRLRVLIIPFLLRRQGAGELVDFRRALSRAAERGRPGLSEFLEPLVEGGGILLGAGSSSSAGKIRLHNEWGLWSFFLESSLNEGC